MKVFYTKKLLKYLSAATGKPIKDIKVDDEKLDIDQKSGTCRYSCMLTPILSEDKARR